jgi:hypothetical protein
MGSVKEKGLMAVFVVLGVFAVVFILLSRQGSAAVIIQTDWLIRTLKIEAITAGIDQRILVAVAAVESGGGRLENMDPRAYNPEGFEPPPGRPAILGTIGRLTVPVAFDLTGFQGSFGLCQVFHGSGWSTAQAYGDPYRSYPHDLMDPQHNAQIAARFLRDLVGKGFRFPDQIDVYNLGETKFNRGKRNPEYVEKVKAVLSREF